MALILDNFSPNKLMNLLFAYAVRHVTISKILLIYIFYIIIYPH